MRASVALILFACNSDFEIQQGADKNAASPGFSVSPSTLSIEAPLGESATEIVTLRNDGDAALQLLGAEIVSGARFSVLTPNTDRLEPGESTELVVTFEALSAAEQGLLRVYSDDPDLESAEVLLYGSALTPLLAIQPDPVAFGSRTVECTWEQRVDLFNDGDVDLTIDAMLASGDRFSISEEPDLPVVLAPGASAPLSVSFSPLEPLASFGTLVVSSDDPGGDRQVSITGTGAAASLTEQAFQQGFDVREDIDILVYIDKSGSMGDDNSRLKDNAADFMDQLSALDTNYQIMVVTEDFGCHNESIITPATASPVDVFSAALDGPSGGATEAGLSVALKALEASGVGDCNAGFLRDEVALSVILISDEPEQSPAGWEDTLDEILAIEPDTIVSAIAGDMPTGCETADPGEGYYEAVQATGGVFLSICETDWSPHIDAISDISTKVPGDLTDTFYLSSYPDPDTIVVTVDGAETDAWRYDEKLNAVVFDALPADEADIYITFTRGCGG